MKSVIFAPQTMNMLNIMGSGFRFVLFFLSFPLLMVFVSSCQGKREREKAVNGSSAAQGYSVEEDFPDDQHQAVQLLVSPENPLSGEILRMVSTGGKDILKAEISVSGPSGQLKTLGTKSGVGIPCWRVDEFRADHPGTYRARIMLGKTELNVKEFRIETVLKMAHAGSTTDNPQGWDPRMEELYSAWINALFDGCGEDASWKSLHEVTRNKEKNFLYNHLSLNEDDPDEKVSVTMQPDCADNPFFFRAYFAWKMGLPFGYHISDRGGSGRSPSTGTWVTMGTQHSKPNQVSSFNIFLRKVMNGVHSGTARTSFENERSDYYPVPLTRQALRPGVVFADPYGHTLVIVGWKHQTSKNPGMLLAVDAQPDGTVGIKRFWKGNFLFNTSSVIGEPGFKAFRPIVSGRDGWELMKNHELTDSSGFIPYSAQQQKMESEAFYHTMERLINPNPLDPGAALTDLIKALHEQLLVRVTSVANGEVFFKKHPGAIISMPSSANGIFQTGGDWENFSTPNRDLRLLIAIDAVLDFPEQVVKFPEDFKLSGFSSSEKIQDKLQKLLHDQVSELFITYSRSDGSSQQLTLQEILERRDAFEMGWNPNDGPEIRWGAPENSEERSACKRKAPAAQTEKMKTFRLWFQQRLHPPT